MLPDSDVQGLHSADKDALNWLEQMASKALALAVYKAISHSNETHALIANPPNNAQLGATPTIPPSYIRVPAIVSA